MENVCLAQQSGVLYIMQYFTSCKYSNHAVLHTTQFFAACKFSMHNSVQTLVVLTSDFNPVVHQIISKSLGMPQVASILLR